MSNEKKAYPVSIAEQHQENFVSIKKSHFLVLDSELAAVGAAIAAEQAKQSSRKDLKK